MMILKLCAAVLPLFIGSTVSAQEVTVFERLQTIQELSKELNNPGVLYGFVRFTSKGCDLCERQAADFGQAIYRSVGYIANNERAKFFTVNLDAQDETGRKMLESLGSPNAGDIRIFKDSLNKEVYSNAPDSVDALTKAVENLVEQSEAPDPDVVFIDSQAYKERHPNGFDGWTVFYTGARDLRTDIVSYEIKSRSWSRSDKVEYVFIPDEDSAGLTYLGNLGVPTTQRHLTIYHENAVVEQYDVADFKARARFRDKFDEFDIW